MIVKLRRKNARFPELTPGLPYVVIGIEADDYRILNDQGRPYLYPSRLFRIIDSSKPKDWVTEQGVRWGIVRLSAATERRWIF
jgi:hypothetical protein